MKARNSPASSRGDLQRIDRLPIAAAEREMARRELERAEAFAVRLAAMLQRVNEMLAGSANAFDTRRERLE